MKIVFVSDAIYPYNKGGKEKRLFEISKRLAIDGHEVHIYTMHWWHAAEQTRIEHGITLHAICKKYDMYNGDRRSIKEGLFFAWACLKLIRVSFDVIDVDHMPFFPLFSTWIVCKLRGKKLHATWHEALSYQDWVDYMGKPGFIAFIIERLSTKLPDYITAASVQTRELLDVYHHRSKNVSLVTSGIAVKELGMIHPAAIKCDVLYFGRLVKDKNVDKLIRAINDLRPSRPNVQCLIVGHGVEKKRLQNLINKLDLQGNVELVDPLPDARDVYAYMKAARVFCLPSVREGFGIVALEALGCNTPVITIDAPANAARHLVDEGKTGSVVALKSNEIARAIDYWLTRERKRSISPRVAHYDWSKLARQQAQVYAT
jgi:glycosyltransferase involved in cell wall biosynthesis